MTGRRSTSRSGSGVAAQAIQLQITMIIMRVDETFFGGLADISKFGGGYVMTDVQVSNIQITKRLYDDSYVSSTVIPTEGYRVPCDSLAIVESNYIRDEKMSGSVMIECKVLPTRYEVYQQSTHRRAILISTSPYEPYTKNVVKTLPQCIDKHISDLFDHARQPSSHNRGSYQFLEHQPVSDHWSKRRGLPTWQGKQWRELTLT